MDQTSNQCDQKIVPVFACIQVDEGMKARRTLIQANGRLVISIASKYTGHGLSLAELSQEGVLGLIRAIDKFDVTKGVRLSTYASYWIRQSVSRAVAVQTLWRIQ